MGTARRVFSNAVILLSADLVRVGFGVALMAVVARRLGEGALGALSYMLALVSILAVLSDVGLSQFYMRAAQHDRGGATLGAVLVLRLLAGTLAASGLAAYASQAHDLRPLLLIGSLLLWFSVIPSWVTAFLRAWERMGREGGAKVIGSVLTLAGTIFVIHRGYGITAVAGVMAGVSVITGSYLIWTAVRLMPRPLKLRHGPAAYGLMLRTAWPFAALAVLGTIYFRIDSVMLFAMRGREALGQYSAAYKVMEAGLLVPWVFSASALPSIVRRLTTAPGDVLQASRHALHFLFAVSIPAAVVGAVLAPQIFQVVYGPGFGEAASIFRILAFTLIAVFASSVTSTLIAAGPRPGVNAVIAVVMVMENVGLNAVVIPHWSGTGAAAATLATEVTGLVLGTVYLNRVFGGPRYVRLIPKPALGAAAAGIVALLSPTLAVIPVSAAVYLAVLWVTRDITAADMDLLRGLVARAQPVAWTDPT